MPALWSQSDVRTLRMMAAAGASNPKIARVIGKSTDCVRKKRIALGLRQIEPFGRVEPVEVFPSYQEAAAILREKMVNLATRSMREAA